jgi:hypothetical protein
VNEESFLSDDFLRQLISVGDVDLLVGISSHNGQDKAGQFVPAVEDGLLRKFRRERIALVQVGAGSKNENGGPVGTDNALGKHGGIESLRTLRWITTNSETPASPDTILRTMLTAADLLHAKACAVIAPSSEDVIPARLESLLQPIYRENYDFVAPLYARPKYDALLTRNLLYPICRTLYGQPLRELRAAEFGFSGRLAAHCLARGEWQNDGWRGGAEMWMAITAMSNSFRCAQTYLGEKSRATSNASVVEAIRRTVGGLFWCLESTASFWLKGAAAEGLHTIGPEHQLTNKALRVERKKLFQMYRSGVADLSQILAAILDMETRTELVRLATLEESACRLSNSLWVRTIYEFAAAYHHSVINRDHLVQAFVPIYRGRVHSLLAEHRSADSSEMEADLQNLCREFETQKDFFFERWKTKGQGAS